MKLKVLCVCGGGGLLFISLQKYRKNKVYSENLRGKYKPSNIADLKFKNHKSKIPL
eukprot:UN16147